MTQGRLLRRIPPAVIAGFLAAGALVAPALAQTQAPLGRLFFTPEKRQLLDRQRDLNVQAQQETPEDPTLTINGVVTRSSGKRTVWINGVAQNEKDRSPDVTVIPQARNPAHVAVQPAQSPATQARVGDTVNRNTGETTHLIGNGFIKPDRATTQRN
jgi:hypothetical protein